MRFEAVQLAISNLLSEFEQLTRNSSMQAFLLAAWLFDIVQWLQPSSPGIPPRLPCLDLPLALYFVQPCLLDIMEAIHVNVVHSFDKNLIVW